MAGDAADMMNVNLTLNDLGFDDKVLATIAHDDIDSDMVDDDMYFNTAWGDDGDGKGD